MSAIRRHSQRPSKHGMFVAVRGGSGAGKSAVLAASSRRVLRIRGSSGAAVAAIPCSASTRTTPFSWIAALLRHLCASRVAIIMEHNCSSYSVDGIGGITDTSASSFRPRADQNTFCVICSTRTSTAKLLPAPWRDIVKYLSHLKTLADAPSIFRLLDHDSTLPEAITLEMEKVRPESCTTFISDPQ